MNYLKIFILVILISIAIGSWCNVMADDIIQDNFIEIPSYLTEGVKEEIVTNSIGLECTGCLDFCEVYDECCNYENCQGTCQTCLGCEGGCQSGCESCESCQSGQEATNAVLTLSGISKTYLTATVSGLNPNGTVLNIEFYANNVFKKGIMTSSATEVSTFIEGLSSNTTYTITAKIYNVSTSTLLKTLSKTTTTDGNPKLSTPTLDTSRTVKTDTSITVTTNAVSGANTYYFRINSGTIINNGVIATHAFTGLTPNTQYYIEIKVGGSGYEDSDWVGYYATTLVAEYWQWTTNERTALNNNGKTTVLTYLRWNAFVDKIYEMCSGDWWISSTDGATLNYTATKMTSVDRVLTANRFNSVRYNIGSRVPTGISRVYTDDDVYGSYFITLETKLNEWIAST